MCITYVICHVYHTYLLSQLTVISFSDITFEIKIKPQNFTANILAIDNSSDYQSKFCDITFIHHSITSVSLSQITSVSFPKWHTLFRVIRVSFLSLYKPTYPIHYKWHSLQDSRGDESIKYLLIWNTLSYSPLIHFTHPLPRLE